MEISNNKRLQKLGYVVVLLIRLQVSKAWLWTTAHYPRLANGINRYWRLDVDRRLFATEKITGAEKYHRLWFCCWTVGHFIRCSLCLLRHFSYDICRRRRLCSAFLLRCLEWLLWNDFYELRNFILLGVFDLFILAVFFRSEASYSSLRSVILNCCAQLLSLLFRKLFSSYGSLFPSHWAIFNWRKSPKNSETTLSLRQKRSFAFLSLFSHFYDLFFAS